MADAGFPLRSYMITPFVGSDDRLQERFNKALSNTRVKVEQVIGQLKQRFRTLLYVSNDNPCVRTDYFHAACILHNMALLAGESWPSGTF